MKLIDDLDAGRQILENISRGWARGDSIIRNIHAAARVRVKCDSSLPARNIPARGFIFYDYDPRIRLAYEAVMMTEPEHLRRTLGIDNQVTSILPHSPIVF